MLKAECWDWKLKIWSCRCIGVLRRKTQSGRSQVLRAHRWWRIQLLSVCIHVGKVILTDLRRWPLYQPDVISSSSSSHSHYSSSLLQMGPAITAPVRRHAYKHNCPKCKLLWRVIDLVQRDQKAVDLGHWDCSWIPVHMIPSWWYQTRHLLKIRAVNCLICPGHVCWHPLRSQTNQPEHSHSVWLLPCSSFNFFCAYSLFFLFSIFFWLIGKLHKSA